MFRVLPVPSLWLLPIALSTLVLLTNPTSGQGFSVSPMRIEVEVPAGRVASIPLELGNTSGLAPQVMELMLLDVTQHPEGSWRPFTASEDIDTSALMSAREWIELESTEVEVAASERQTVDVRLQVPRDSRGTYLAALLVRSRPLGSAEAAVRLQVQFMVPLILTIEGRPVPQRVALSDLSMLFLGGNENETKPTTTAAMHVTNSGRTYSRIHGTMSVERQSGDRWRQVTRFDISERGIIPGVTLSLSSDLDRRLPSGKYRLRADLRVDGRRIAPLVKEIEFEGDPTVDSLAYDTQLTLSPALVEMGIAPGATRTTALRIENPGEDAIDVEIAVETPNVLQGVAMGGLRGDALSAEPWTEVRPAKFTIRPRGRQNVRVISRVPREDVDHPNYYADLTLQGHYGDGQSAGETRSTVRLVNGGVESEAKGIIERVNLAEAGAASQYVLQARFINSGTVHLEPEITVEMLNVRGSVIMSQSMAAEHGPLLPFGTRSFGAELDFSQIEAGAYVLRATARFGGGQHIATDQYIEVREQDVADGDAEAPKEIRSLSRSEFDLMGEKS